MGFTGSISGVSARMMPFAAILRHDSHALWVSWLVWLWLAASALLTLVLVVSNWVFFQTAPLIASLLFTYLVFPWPLMVMVLSVGPVSGARAEAMADGILSRPVTRYEYLWASWTARVLLVLGVFLAVAVPAILLVALADRPPAADRVTFYGTLCALAVVGLVLVFLVSMGFFLGILLRNQLLALVVLAFLWFPVNMVLSTFHLEEFSPISLSQALPTLLRQPWRQSDSAEAKLPNPEAAARELDRWLKVNVFGSGPQRRAEPAFFDRGEFKDFRLGRVLLGYGIPTLLAVTLATLCFCLRDL